MTANLRMLGVQLAGVILGSLVLLDREPVRANLIVTTTEVPLVLPLVITAGRRLSPRGVGGLALGIGGGADMTTREEIKQKLEAELAQAQTKLAELKARAAEKVAEQRAGHAEQIEHVERAVAAARDKLKEIGEAGEDAWERLREGAESTWKTLSESVRKTFGGGDKDKIA